MGAKAFNKKQFFWALSLAVSVIGTVFSIATIFIDRDYRKPLPPYPIGNRPALVNVLKEKGFPFSFLVISDTHNDENAYALFGKILQQTDASFLIHVGDAVNAPSIWRHRYFIKRMTEGIRPPFPVFLAPGNHDIYYGFQRVPEGERVTPEVYQSLYGAMSFDFTFNNCLFILCGVDLNKPDAFLGGLRDVLAKNAPGKKYVFLFFHYPPTGMMSGFDFPREREFFSLLESYKVTSCFFGHYHGYRRKQVNGTNLIVLGGGGGALKSWQSEWGKFHHALKVTVGENSLAEDIMVLKNEPLFHHSFEWRIVADILPLVQNRLWVVYGFTLACLFLGFFSFLAIKSGVRLRKE
jgi:predicted phosphodiesterase